MKTILIIIAVVVILGLLYLYSKLSVQKISFKFDIGKIDLSIISLSNPVININVLTTIDNKNNFEISFSDLFVRLLYNDNLVAKSKNIDINKYKVPAKSSFSFNQELELYINSSTIGLIKSLVSRQPVKIDYEVDVKIFNIKVPTIKDYFNLP